MKKALPHTALLIFSRSAAAEAQHKTLSNVLNLRERTRLNKALLSKTLVTANHSGLPVVLMTEQLQQGNSFGEKLSNAIASVFSRGYEKIIVVGGDCPDLHENHISSASRVLDGGKCLLGPALDGGVYLFALNKSQFDRQSFANLPWQSDSLYAALKSEMGMRSEIEHTVLLQDVDDAQSLHQYILFGKNSAVSALIFSMLRQSTTLVAAVEANNYLHLVKGALELRGPPQVVA